MGVNKATRKLYPVANTPQQILDLGLDGLCEHIKTIGLYKSKAKHLLETCRILIEQHGGEVPRTREALEALRDQSVEDGLMQSIARVYELLRLHHPATTQVRRTNELPDSIVLI